MKAMRPEPGPVSSTELRDRSPASGPRGGEAWGQQKGQGAERSAWDPCPPDAPRDVRVRKIKPLSEIHSGNSVSLQCDFSSSHPKEVQFFWEKNGRLLGKESRLNFDSISPEDAGSYSCWVNNSIGQTASKAWTLEVLCE